jgi:hypothetical protein
MENYSKIIDSVIKKLDWDTIMKYYDYVDYEEGPNKRKRVQIKTKGITTIKKELRDLIQFVIDGNLNEIQHVNWIISWKNNETGFKLDIIFAPVRASITDTSEFVEEECISNSDLAERDVLKDMLNKSILEENYELSAVIHSRLKKLDKILTSK